MLSVFSPATTDSFVAHVTATRRFVSSGHATSLHALPFWTKAFVDVVRALEADSSLSIVPVMDNWFVERTREFGSVALRRPRMTKQFLNAKLERMRLKLAAPYAINLMGGLGCYSIASTATDLRITSCYAKPHTDALIAAYVAANDLLRELVLDQNDVLDLRPFGEVHEPWVQRVTG